jgi:hypothetical protein
MSLAAAFLLAAASAQAAPADEPRRAGQGAQVATAEVSVRIVRAASLKGGALVSARNPDSPRSQRHDESGRITYAFE